METPVAEVTAEAQPQEDAMTPEPAGVQVEEVPKSLFPYQRVCFCVVSHKTLGKHLERLSHGVWASSFFKRWRECALPAFQTSSCS